jgi:hypothetical protein
MKSVVLLLASVMLCHGASAAEVVTLNLRGTITARTLDRFFEAVEKVRGDPVPAGLIVQLDSPGGDGVAAMRIGRVARAHRAHVFVRGRCASACIFILAGGVVRSAGEGKVGVHRGTLTQFRPGVGSVPADLSLPEAKAVLARAERDAAEYLAEMGMPAELMQLMNSVPYNSMRWLTGEEARRLGLVGVDAAYARERAGRATRAPSADAALFESRSLAVQDACPAFDPPGVFIECYRTVLDGSTTRPSPKE